MNIEVREMKRKAICIVTFVLLAVQFTGCGKEKSECENVINEFEYACNELDVDAMLRCLHPDVADPIRAVLSLANMVSGEETEDIVDMISSELGGQLESGNIDSDEMFNSLDIEVTDYKEDGGSADVYADISFEIAGKKKKKYGVFYMEQVDEQWYISSFDFAADTAK